MDTHCYTCQSFRKGYEKQGSKEKYIERCASQNMRQLMVPVDGHGLVNRVTYKRIVTETSMAKVVGSEGCYLDKDGAVTSCALYVRQEENHA